MGQKSLLLGGFVSFFFIMQDLMVVDPKPLHGLVSHSAVSIVTKRWSGWFFLLGVEIKPALNSIFGILALGTKDQHFGCRVPLVLTGKSKNNGMLLVVLGPW